MVQSRSSTTLYSGALAKAAAVSPDTIRYYERIGVLPRASRTGSGYPSSVAVVVQFEIHRAGNRAGPVGNCGHGKPRGSYR
jgi:hypothetical protein